MCSSQRPNSSGSRSWASSVGSISVFANLSHTRCLRAKRAVVARLPVVDRMVDSQGDADNSLGGAMLEHPMPGCSLGEIPVDGARPAARAGRQRERLTRYASYGYGYGYGACEVSLDHRVCDIVILGIGKKSRDTQDETQRGRNPATTHGGGNRPQRYIGTCTCVSGP